MRLNQDNDDEQPTTVPRRVRARYEHHETIHPSPERELAWNGTTRVLIDAISHDKITCLGHQVAHLPGRRITVHRERLHALLDVLAASQDETPQGGDRVTFYIEPGAPLALKRPGAGWCMLLAPLVSPIPHEANTGTRPGDDQEASA